jgi:hypothetical protein
VFAVADVVYFLAHKLAGLCAGRFSLARVSAGAFHCFPVWHARLFSHGCARLRAAVALGATIAWWADGCAGCRGIGGSRGRAGGIRGLPGCTQLFFRFEPMGEVLSGRLSAFDKYFVSAP